MGSKFRGWTQDCLQEQEQDNLGTENSYTVVAICTDV